MVCFYCEAPVVRHEHDHAPIPRRAGGNSVVVTCVGCHNLKDRLQFSSWPLTLALMAVQELTRLDAMPAQPVADWPAEWDDMTSHARLLWAKCVAMGSGGPDIDWTRHYQAPA